MKILLFSDTLPDVDNDSSIEFVKAYFSAEEETANLYFEKLFKYAIDSKSIFTVYPDMLSLTATNQSLQSIKEKGKDIRTVQNMEEALLNAKRKRRNTVIFPAFHYQNLTAAAAATLMKAMMDGITNFKILNDLKSEKALLEGLLMKDKEIDGVLLTKGVADMFGKNKLMELAAKYNVYFSSSDIQAQDVSENLQTLIHNIHSQNHQQNLHASIRDIENRTIDAVISEVFELKDADWNNYGFIPKSKYKIREKYDRYELNDR